MSSQSPDCLWNMCIGPDEGCHEVPDPIAPIDMMFVSLDPTRMPRLWPFITINGPMFMFIPPMSTPGIAPMGLGIGLDEGLADGSRMFMSIFCWGDACGFGEDAGICMPGMCVCVCGDAEGDAGCICIPGIFISI